MTDNEFELKRWARWLGTFIGFPLAGVTARAVAGNIDSVPAAALGGLAGGAVLGAVQVAIGGIGSGSGSGSSSGSGSVERIRWIGATAAGLALGLTAGAGSVDFQTDPASLAAMGAISGAFVGVAQATAVPMRLVDRILWAAATPVLWAGGWLITAQVIVDTERQHAVFGSSGAIVVSGLAGVLYAVRQRSPRAAAEIAGPSTGSAVAS